MSSLILEALVCNTLHREPCQRGCANLKVDGGNVGWTESNKYEDLITNAAYNTRSAVSSSTCFVVTDRGTCLFRAPSVYTFCPTNTSSERNTPRSVC